MSNLRTFINKKYATGEAAALLGYTHRNGLAHVLNNPRKCTFETMIKIANIMEVPKRKIYDLVISDIENAENTGKKRPPNK